MKRFKKLDHCEYKIFKDRVKVSKKSVMDKYKNGEILVYVEKEEHIEVCAIFCCDFGDVEKIKKEIKSVELPELETETEGEAGYGSGPSAQYCFLCVAPRRVASRHSSDITTLLAHLNNYYTYDYYISTQEDENTAELFLVAGYSGGMFCSGSNEQRKLRKTFGVKPVDRKELFENNVSWIREWIKENTYYDFYEAISSRVIGQENLKIVLTNIYMYIKSIADGKKISRNNFILAAPSGCGKTETYRAIKEYFKEYIPSLPISLIDTNRITSEGFFGKNTNFIVKDLKSSYPNGIGIVFLDEFDKKLIPCHSSHGDNVNGQIQGQLLLAIEGVELDGIDTNNTMFIGLGSFNVVREMKAQRRKVTKFGFGQDSGCSDYDHYSRITREDMIELGASYELIGRFTSVIDYDRLSYEAIDRIIDLRLKEISDEFEVPISVSDEMRRLIHENANTEFGNRMIRSLIVDGVVPAKAEMFMNGIEAKEIVVTGKGQYQIRSARTV